jgi:hypothetical protein
MKKSPQKLLADIAEFAIHDMLLGCARKRPIGYFIKRLSKTDREILENLKSEQIEDDMLQQMTGIKDFGNGIHASFNEIYEKETSKFDKETLKK